MSKPPRLNMTETKRNKTPTREMAAEMGEDGDFSGSLVRGEAAGRSGQSRHIIFRYLLSNNALAPLSRLRERGKT